MNKLQQCSVSGSQRPYTVADDLIILYDILDAKRERFGCCSGEQSVCHHVIDLGKALLDGFLVSYVFLSVPKHRVDDNPFVATQMYGMAYLVEKNLHAAEPCGVGKPCGECVSKLAFVSLAEIGCHGLGVALYELLCVHRVSVLVRNHNGKLGALLQVAVVISTPQHPHLAFSLERDLRRMDGHSPAGVIGYI